MNIAAISTISPLQISRKALEDSALIPASNIRAFEALDILDKDFMLSGYNGDDPQLSTILVALNVSDKNTDNNDDKYTFREDGGILSVTSASEIITFGYNGDLPTSCIVVDINTGVETTGIYTYDDESVMTNMEMISTNIIVKHIYTRDRN